MTGPAAGAACPRGAVSRRARSMAPTALRRPFPDPGTRDGLAARWTGTLHEAVRVFRPGAGTGLGGRPPDPACPAVERVEGRRHGMARG